MAFDGLGLHMGNLSLLSAARTRSISPENPTGAKGAGGMAVDGTGATAAADLGRGWKVSPSVVVPAGATLPLADIEGPGALEQIWMTPALPWRNLILRIHWDDQDQASVECPVGDFFAAAWPGQFGQVSSLAVCVNPVTGLNCYWEMPFRRRCRISLENTGDADATVYYQVGYVLTDVPAEAAYFHAQFRRSNPLAYQEVHTLVDGVRGQGHYVGSYLAWDTHGDGWWGEGELKWYVDGDEWPTVCGTGVEDYFGGSYGFAVDGSYASFTTPYSGMPQVVRRDGDPAAVPTRFGLYRWHVTDPIRFAADLRVTVQALGWAPSGRYLPLADDIASVAYWYQTLPTAPFPPLPGREALEIR